MTPSPWLAAQLQHERAARHERNRAFVRRIVSQGIMGATAGAAAVILLQFFGVLSK